MTRASRDIAAHFAALQAEMDRLPPGFAKDLERHMRDRDRRRWRLDPNPEMPTRKRAKVKAARAQRRKQRRKK